VVVPVPVALSESTFSAPKQAVSAVSAYEQYVIEAKRKGWWPTDPLEKLSNTVAQYGTFFDPSDMNKSMELMTMLKSEFDYLLNVLVRTPDRKFDLNKLLFENIEMIKRSYFKSMKNILFEGAK
jgi:hypothetical protein